MKVTIALDDRSDNFMGNAERLEFQLLEAMTFAKKKGLYLYAIRDRGPKTRFPLWAPDDKLRQFHLNVRDKILRVCARNHDKTPKVLSIHVELYLSVTGTETIALQRKPFDGR